MDDQQIIASRQLQVERKFLSLDHCENVRGRFPRTREEIRDWRGAWVVPVLETLG